MASQFIRPRVSTLPTKKNRLQTELEKRKKQNEEKDDFQEYMSWLNQQPENFQTAAKNQAAQATYSTQALRPSTPVLNYDRGLAKQNLFAREKIINRNRAAGLYDTEQVVFNPETSFMASDDYLKQLQTSIGVDLEASKAKDARYEEHGPALENWWYTLDGRDPQDRDLMAMDTILGGKEYQTWDVLSDDDRNRLMTDYAQIADQMSGYKEYESQTPALQAKWDALDKETKRRNTGYREMSEALRADPNFQANSVYTPMTGESYTGYLKSRGALEQFFDPYDADNETAILYDYIMNPAYASEYESARSYQGQGTPYSLRGLDLLWDDEKAEAAAAMAQGEEYFAEWLAALEATETLTQRKAMLDKAAQENYALHPVTALPMFAAVRAANLGNSIMTPIQAGAAMLGYDDPNSPLYATNRLSQNVSSVQAEKAGELMPWQVPFTNQKFGSLLYNGVSSVSDFALARGIGGSGNAATAITQYIMSSQAASNTIYNALEEGQDPTEAVVRGMVSGAIEAFTEKYSIEALLKNPTMFAAFVGQNMATEASEEVLASVLNTGADWFISKLYGHEDALTTEYEALTAQLGDPKEASRQVLQNFLLSLGTDAVLGGFTGGAMGAAVGAQTSAQRNAVGKEVSALGNVSKLVDIGLTMDVNGESNPIAKNIRQAEESGKKVSNRQVGRLYETMYRELDEESRAVVTDTMRDAVAERMVELGDSPEVAQEAADAVLAVVRNEKPTLGQRQSMARAQNSSQVIKEIMFADDTTSEGRMRHSEWVRTADEKANAASASSLRKMGEIRQTRVGKEATDQAIQRATVNAQQLVAKKATDKKSMDVELEDGQSAEILQVSNAEGEAKVTIKGADGKKQTVSGSALRMKSKPVAAIVSYLDTTPERMSDEQANLLLHSYTGGDAMEHIADFNDAYAAGFMARELPPSKRMDRRMAQQIAEQGRKDAEAAEQKRQATIGAIAKGRRGAATFTENMADAGSERALKAVSGRLSDIQKKSVAAIKQLARATGVNFVFFESQADSEGRYTAENGHYDVKTGTIYLDLNSGKNSTTDLAEYAILRTAGHELTHFMEHSSKEGYAALRDFVTTELTRRGEDFDALVVKKMDNAARAGAPLTRAGAISEVVADASELMLRDTKAIERLAQKDQGLMAKIKGFIQSFVQKVRDAFSGVDAVHEEARVMMQELAEEFQQKWDFALEEAVEQAQKGVREDAELREAVEAQYQLRDSSGNVISLSEEAVEQNKRYVANMTPVITLEGNPMASPPEGDFFTAGAAYFKSIGGKAENPVLGTVALNEKGIRHLINRKLSWRKTALLRAVKPVIEKGRILHVENDHNNKDTAIIAASVELDGTKYYMGVVVSQVDGEDNRYEVHDAVIVQKQKEGRNRSYKDTAAGMNQTGRGDGNPHIAIILSQLADYNREFAENQQSLREQTETPEFKRWFKNSQVVDPDGNPKVMYHGTAREFWTFDKRKANDLTGRRMGLGSGKGKFYLTEYEGSANAAAYSAQSTGRGNNPKVMELYVSAQKVMDAAEYRQRVQEAYKRHPNSDPQSVAYDYQSRDKALAEVDRAIRKEGYDGVWDRESGEMFVFEPEQIKSATDNVGTFDPENPDVRYSLRNQTETALSVYEQYRDVSAELTKAAEHKAKAMKAMTDSGELDQVMELLKNNPEEGTDAYKKLLEKYGMEKDRTGELQKQANALYKKYEELQDAESASKEAQAIEKSGKTPAEYHRAEAVKVFGYTPYFVDAGYLLPNGKMLNFSGEKGKHYGMRGDDHRAIGQVFANLSGSEAMVRFMHEGNIRLMPESPGMDIATTVEPTAQQYTAIRKFVREYADQEQLSIDFTDENGREVGSLVYDGRILADRVVNDIRYFFETGEIREQGVGAFHYSLRDMPAISTREYIAAMQPTASMTDSEKWLLGKYQRTAEELREKEADLAEQIRLSSEADTPEEQQKAKNRVAILRSQANRLRNTLSQAERAEGFATIMRTSSEVVNNYIAGRNAGQVEDAADALDAELEQIRKDLTAVAADISNAESGWKAAYARGLFNSTALNNAASTIRKSYNLRMPVKELANRLALAYAEMYANEGSEGHVRFYNAMQDLARDILASSRNRYRSSILDMLRENVGTISLSEAQEQELKKAGISVSEFKRVVDPVVKVSRGKASDLSAIVSSAEYYGTGLVTIFSESDSEGDMILKLYNVIQEERAKERAGAFEGMSTEDSVKAILLDVIGDTYLPLAEDEGSLKTLRAELLKGIEGNRTLAAKVDKAIETSKRALKSSGAIWRRAAEVEAAGKKAVAYYRAIDEQRRLMELREQKQEITQQLRSKAAQELLAEQTRYRQMIVTEREIRKNMRKAAHLQDQIADKVKKLDHLRRHETDYKNVPEAFKPAVDTLVSMFVDNFGTMVFNKNQADRLAEIYSKLMAADGDGPMGALVPFRDPDMLLNLQALQEYAEMDAQLRTTSGKGMTRAEQAALRMAINQSVKDAVDHIYKIITDAQNLFYAGKKAKFAAIGTQMGDALKARQDKKTLRGAAGQALTVMDNLLRTGNMTPVYFFEQLGNEVLSTLWDDIRQGQNAYAFAMRDGRETIQGLQQLYHYWDWADSKRKDNVLEITTEKGRKLTFTREQALWVYATWKREQSNEIAATKHLTEGGIVYEGKTQEGGNVVTTVQTTPAVLSEGDIGRITGWLTDEQKAYADGMVRYLSEDMAELGNRVSMEMFGIRKYTEDYYFPYRVSGDQLYQESTSGRMDTTSDARLKHASHTHALTQGASAPLVMGDFSRSVEDHITRMATYASFVLPIESMNRVLNYKVELDDGARATVRSLIEQKYGESAKKYIATLLTDLNGGVRNDNRASGTDYLVRMYKKGAVAASLSTALQQPTSLFRAMAMISPKYIAASTFSKRDWQELTHYSGVAVIKEMGRFDTDVGRSNIDWLHKKHPRGFMERLDAASGFMPEQLDRLTWAHLWSAVKKEQADLHPEMDKQSEAFLALCGERFNDIVDHTQVYDSILSRSQLMRGKDAMSKMTTSFMAEPTLAINMLYNAAVGITKPGGKAKAAKVMAAVLTSNIAAAAMAALIQAWNDDDDKRSAQTKYLDKFLENALDNNNPLSMLPVVSDVWSMFQGYDVQRADMSLISEMYKAIQRFQSDSYSPYRKVEELLGTTAKFFGLPVKNLLRDGRRAYNLFTSSFESPSSYELSTALPWADDKATAHYEELFLAMHNGDTKREEEIREYLADVKDKKPDTMDEGVRTQLKERFLGGSMDEATAKAWLKTHMGYDNRKAFETVDRWRETQENNGNEEWSYSIYNDFYGAVESGKNLAKEIKQLLDLGIEAKTLASNITSEFKPLLLELLATGKTSQAAALQAKILDAYVALGYDREKKLKDVKKWYSK